MYVPPPNAVPDEDELRAMVAVAGAGELVTVGPDGYPAATRLPVVWRGDRVLAHMARANGHWRAIVPGGPALLVVAGPEAYVSPSWYPSASEHGRVVPTWNYTSVQLRGRVTVHDDETWVRDVVEELTAVHESPRPRPWRVDDAPSAFVTAQLRGIVGVEVAVEQVVGKAKLSQNRSSADRAGVVAGLDAERPGSAVAELMRGLPG